MGDPILIHMFRYIVYKHFQDPAVLGALRCLDLQEVKDTYMLSVMAYAYTLYSVKYPRRLEIMALLRSKLKRKGGTYLKNVVLGRWNI
jgi:hypothetical protein